MGIRPLLVVVVKAPTPYVTRHLDCRYPLLFDPQTSGGLLAAVPAAAADATVARLRALGYPETVVVGRVLDEAPADPEAFPTYINIVV